MCRIGIEIVARIMRRDDFDDAAGLTNPMQLRHHCDEIVEMIYGMPAYDVIELTVLERPREALQIVDHIDPRQIEHVNPGGALQLVGSATDI